MSFTEQETSLLRRLENPTGYPFTLTDLELEQITSAIKRERGNTEAQERRKIRVHVAKLFDWKFAMDGGFMPKEGQLGYPQKIWQDSGYPESKIYHLYEDLVLGLLSQGHTMDELEVTRKLGQTAGRREP